MEFYENNDSNIESVICPNDTYYGCTCEEDIPDELLNCDDDCSDDCLEDD